MKNSSRVRESAILDYPVFVACSLFANRIYAISAKRFVSLSVFPSLFYFAQSFKDNYKLSKPSLENTKVKKYRACRPIWRLTGIPGYTEL